MRVLLRVGYRPLTWYLIQRAILTRVRGRCCNKASSPQGTQELQLQFLCASIVIWSIFGAILERFTWLISAFLGLVYVGSLLLLPRLRPFCDFFPSFSLFPSIRPLWSPPSCVAEGNSKHSPVD